MANYQALRDSLDKNGELQIRLDTGEKMEGTETFWIGTDRISYYWIHKRALCND
jgi:hypothetical protein